jgi:plasmid stability protein
MERKQTRDFLIRNMPIEVYDLLEKAAKEHHRSKTQEAIVALTNGLSMYNHQIKKPIPFKWNKKISSKFIEETIKEGQE